MRKVYQQIAQIAGNVITVQATGVGNLELATVQAPGFSSLAQVIRLEGDRVTMQVFSGTRGIPTDAEIRFLGQQLETPFAEALLGRVFTGGGVPEKTCMVTRSPCRRITWASESKPGACTVASSRLPTPVACTVMTLPAICAICW